MTTTDKASEIIDRFMWTMAHAALAVTGGAMQTALLENARGMHLCQPNSGIPCSVCSQ